jgi:hypothetical protein
VFRVLVCRSLAAAAVRVLVGAKVVLMTVERELVR